MEYKASDGTTYRLPNLSQHEAQKLLPRQFLARLLDANLELSWALFSKKNLTEIIHYVTDQLQLGGDLSVPLATPFEMCPASLKQLTNDWRAIEEFLKFHLPATPAPQAVRMLLFPQRMTFKYLGVDYILPKITHEIFPHDDLDLGRFVKIFLNNHKRQRASIDERVLRKALEQFAIQGFPRARGVLSKYNEWLDRPAGVQCLRHFQVPSDIGSAVKTAKPVKGSRVQATQAGDGRVLTQVGKVRNETGISVGSVVASQLPNAPRIALGLTLPLETALKSENCSFSVQLTKIKSQKPSPEQVKARVYQRLLAQASNGLVRANWHGERVLIIVYQNAKFRDEAYQVIDANPLPPGVLEVQRLGPLCPRQYVAWSIPVSPTETPADFSEALQRYFNGSHYASDYTISGFGSSANKILVTFGTAPPSFGNNIMMGSPRKLRRFKTSLVTANGMPISSDTVVSSGGEAGRVSYGGTTGRRSTEIRGKTKDERIEHLDSDRGDDMDHETDPDASDRLEEAFIDSEANLNQDNASKGTRGHSSDQETLATILVNGTRHKVPSAKALPLHETTFNRFARMYLELGPHRPQKLTAKVMIKLYRVFLETQFPNVQSEARLDAFQRVNFEEDVVDTRPGGLSYSFRNEARDLYQKELLDMDRSLLTSIANTPSTIEPSNEHRRNQQTAIQSRSSHNTYYSVPSVAGSKRKAPPTPVIGTLSEEPSKMARTLPAKMINTSSTLVPSNDPAKNPQTIILSPESGTSTYYSAPEAAGSKRKVSPRSISYRPLTNSIKRDDSTSSQVSGSSSASFKLCSPTSFALSQKQQEPDMLSALERYLDDFDARLQLERELMR